MVLLGWMHGAHAAVKVGGGTHHGAGGQAGGGTPPVVPAILHMHPITRIAPHNVGDIHAAVRRCLSCCQGWTAGSFGGRPPCCITAPTPALSHCMGRLSRWVCICSSAMCSTVRGFRPTAAAWLRAERRSLLAPTRCHRLPCIPLPHRDRCTFTALQGRVMMLAMEYMEGGSLRAAMQRPELRDSLRWQQRCVSSGLRREPKWSWLRCIAGCGM